MILVQFVKLLLWLGLYLSVALLVAHPPVVGEVIGSNRVIAKDAKSCTYCCYVRCSTLIVKVGGMPWPQTGATQYHTQLGLPDKGRAMKVFVVCNEWDLELLDLLNGLALSCYQPSPKVLFVSHAGNIVCKTGGGISLAASNKFYVEYFTTLFLVIFNEVYWNTVRFYPK